MGGDIPPGYMLRVCTREFIREMVDGRVKLPAPVYVKGFGEPLCR